MKTEANNRVFALIAKIKKSSQSVAIFAIIKRLQSLYNMGKRYSDAGTVNIDEIIKQMDLPLDIHLFITGNFNDLMEIDFYDEKHLRKIED